MFSSIPLETVEVLGQTCALAVIDYQADSENWVHSMN